MRVYLADRFPRDEAFLLEEEGHDVEFLPSQSLRPVDDRALISAIDSLQTFSCVATDCAHALDVFLSEAKRLKSKFVFTLGFATENQRCRRTLMAMGLHLIEHRELESLVDTDVGLLLKSNKNSLAWIDEFHFHQVELNLGEAANVVWPEAGVLVVDSIYLAEEVVARNSGLQCVATSKKIAAHLGGLSGQQVKYLETRTPDSLVELISL